MFKRSLPNLFLFASLGAAIGAAVLAPAPASADGDDPIKCSDIKFATIKAACEAGANTEKKMRDQMKDWQKAAKAKGHESKCTDCHTKSSGGPIKEGVDIEALWKEFEKKFKG
jgi:hypothetical protein